MANKVVGRRCPVCQFLGTYSVGVIRHPGKPRVAGVELDLGGEDFELRRCPKCGFQFKHPGIDMSELLACYAKAAPDNWGASPDPRYRKYDVLRDVLEKYSSSGRILDVGCFNGAFLAYVGSKWEKYAVEPARAAAEVAEKRGVKVLADTLDGVSNNVSPFDAILAIDVVEHILDPVPFFQRVADLLRPGGIFVMLTGNTGSLAWRLQGSMYWYCSLPEHVSFFDRQSVDEIAKRSGMVCVAFRALRHKRLPVTRWVADVLKSTAYLAVRLTNGFGCIWLRRTIAGRRGPTLMTAKDHMLCVLRKESID